VRSRTALGSRQRRVIERFARVVCPPGITSADRLPDLMAEVERFLCAFPSHVRRLLLAAFVAFDTGARLHRVGRGRRFVDLDDVAADRYFRARVASRSSAVRNLLTLMRGVVAMSYYELPAVQSELGYDPASYIAEVTARRRVVHGDAIERGERAVFVDLPGRGG
jgi:hypothetical protein